MSYLYHVAVVETDKGKVRLQVRDSKTEAEKDATVFCNGHRPFSIVGLTADQARPLYLADRRTALSLQK
jgi:hypothetical protein